MLELTIDVVRVQQMEAAFRQGAAIPPPGEGGWTVSELVTLAAVAIYRAELNQLVALSDYATASPELKEHFMGICLRELEAAVDFTHDDLIKEGLFGRCRVRIEWTDEDEEPTITRQ